MLLRQERPSKSVILACSDFWLLSSWISVFDSNVPLLFRHNVSLIFFQTFGDLLYPASGSVDMLIDFG